MVKKRIEKEFMRKRMDTALSKVNKQEIKNVALWIKRLKADREKWLPSFQAHCKEYDKKVREAKKLDKNFSVTFW
jgi:hypothetical protein